METKRLIVVMLVGMLIILAWQPFMKTVGSMAGYDMTAVPTTQPTIADATTMAAPTAPVVVLTPGQIPTTIPTTGAVAPNVAVGAATNDWAVVAATTLPSNGAPTIQYIGSDQKEDASYAMQLGISPFGAGLERAVLNNYQTTLRSPDRFTFQLPSGGFVEQTRSLAVRGVTVDGVDVNLLGQVWTPVAVAQNPTDHESVAMELTLARHGVPALVIRRTFTVYKRDAEKFEANGKTYEPLGLEPSVRTTFKNLTDKPMNVALRFNAPTIPPSESERFVDAQYIIGFARDGVVSPDSPHTSDSIKTPADLLAVRKDRTPYWFGTATTYFVTMFRFDAEAGKKEPVDWFNSIDTQTLTPEKYGTERSNDVTIQTKAMAVAANGEGTIGAHVYFGPKKREFLTNAYFSAPWIQYDRVLVIASGPCGFCTWQWLIDILFVVLKTFHAITKDWGLSIIGLVFLVRLCLHPVSKRAQLNMLKFGKLAPEMERIKKKYADDQETMNKEMMRFYREHGSTQLMGCLPMFLQMPVWIALWQAMNTTFELRHQPFLYGFTWIHDLSKPDHLLDFAALGWQTIHIPFLSFVTISGLNVLPFLFGALQFIQFKIQPKPPTMTPEQAQQQQTMQWMMLFLMPVMLYASPSGLMIYMITSFILGITESKIVKRQFARMTADEARFTVVDDDSPARPAGVVKATVRRKDEPKKKGFWGAIADAREKAAEMQREMEKQRKKPR